MTLHHLTDSITLTSTYIKEIIAIECKSGYVLIFTNALGAQQFITPDSNLLYSKIIKLMEPEEVHYTIMELRAYYQGNFSSYFAYSELIKSHLLKCPECKNLYDRIGSQI